MRRLTALLAVTIGTAGATACEPPPPPPPVLQVNSYTSSSDAVPGDGVCETSSGSAECTITAAIQEGNALGSAVIEYPRPADEDVEPPLDAHTVTGDLTIRGTFTSDRNETGIVTDHLVVTTGATLRLESFTMVVDLVTVDGTLVLDRSLTIADYDISPGGLFMALNSIVWSSSDGAGERAMVVNDGAAWFRYSGLYSAGPVLHTGPSATSALGATSIVGQQGAGCSGTAVLSEGYNDDQSRGDDGSGGCVGEELEGGDTHEQIPVGVLGCGTAITIDNYGAPRPVDDDGDGDPRCAVGPVESSFR